MAEPFSFKSEHTRFHCGSENKHVQLAVLSGPNGARATAYSCSMNIDVDGEPECYGPPTIRPMPRDNLWNAGWLSQHKNAERKAAYDADFPPAMEQLQALRTQLAAAPDHAAKAAIERQIHDVRVVLHKLNPYYESHAPNNGLVFWHWYGVYAMTPSEAAHAVYDEGVAGVAARRPLLDTRAEFADVYGKYPVIQSKFEPSPGFYVSPISKGASPKYKKWDQRYYLPSNVASSHDPVQPPFGALSSGLKHVAGVVLGDQLLAIKRDSGISLAFPFRDGAYGNKVAECSLSAFLALGGKEGKDRRHWDNSNFELLYLAFPGGQAPRQALANFAAAENADEFPVLLSFLAGTRGAADAVQHFVQWRRSSAPGMPSKPPYFEVIEPALRNAGFRA